MRVVVLLGGDSEEREVSLSSGCQVADALRDVGHEVVALDPVGGALTRGDEKKILTEGVGSLPPAEIGLGEADRSSGVPARSGAPTRVTISHHEEIFSADVVFPALHGGTGEDGTLQALLDLGGCTYAGSAMLGCALAMDKDVTKRLLRDAGIRTADWLMNPIAEEAVERLGLPMIAKPVAGGSSVRLYLLDTLEAVRETIDVEGERSRERGHDVRSVRRRARTHRRYFGRERFAGWRDRFRARLVRLRV
jgi:D-alanine-D-alanine ligase